MQNKVCTTGKACGDSCIAADKNCTGIISGDSAGQITNLADEIKAIGLNRDDVTSGTADIIKNAPKAPQKTAGDELLSPESAKQNLDYAKRIADGERSKKVFEVEDELVAEVWGKLDGKTRSSLNSKGGPSRIPKGDPAEFPGTNTERGQAVLKRYMEQDFTDPATGQRGGWRDDLTIDHVIPLDQGGTDTPDNWEITSQVFNQIKGANTNEKLFSDLEKQANRSQEDYQSEKSSAELRSKAKSGKADEWAQNYQLLSKDTIGEAMDKASAADVKNAVKAAKLPGKSHRFITSAKNRGDYAKSDTMKGLLKLHKGAEPSEAEVKSMVADIARDNKKGSNAEKADKMLSNLFDSAEQRAEIISKYKLS